MLFRSAIFLYILLRFRNLAFSVGAIVALALDALIVIGIYSLCWGWVPMSLEIDQVFIGAILTVIGYSINDKVVVFDRIRENLGLYSALWGILPMSLEIDQVFIGAILTVIGYSINDKVVVFDRIRENIGLYGKRDRQQLFNDSLNQTLARTINTSVTTLIVLLAIFILGGDSIRSFSFAMILGVVFGTLSSLFIAAPVAYLTLGRTIKEEEEVKAPAKK